MNVKLLKEKNFSLLMIGKFISLTGTQMQEFALSLYVLKITGSATLFASVLIVAMIPQLILGPIAGVLADWLDRKKLIIYLDLLSGLIVGIFAIIFMLTGGLSVGYIYILVILLTLSSCLYQPATGTIIPTIIKKEELMDANGISSLITTVGNLISPLLAGLLMGLYGLFIILLLDCISFLVSAIAEMFIQIPKLNKMPEKITFKVFKDDFTEGLKFIKGNKLLLYIIILAPILNFVFAPLSSISLSYIVIKLFKISDFQYGIMQMIIITSMFISPFIASKISKKYSLGKILFSTVFITSLLIALMSLTPSPFFINLFTSNFIPYISITILFFLICMVMTTSNIALSTLFQKIVPNQMLGRVGTVLNTGSMALAPLGLALFGFLIDALSPWVCVLISALILFVTILIFRKPLCSTEDTQPLTNITPSMEMASTLDIESK